MYADRKPRGSNSTSHPAAPQGAHIALGCCNKHYIHLAATLPFRGSVVVFVFKVIYLTTGPGWHLMIARLPNMIPVQKYASGNVAAYAIGRKPCHQQPRIYPRSADKY